MSRCPPSSRRVEEPWGPRRPASVACPRPRPEGEDQGGRVGISTLETEFLANMMMKNGMTVGQAILPRLSEACDSGRLLPPAEERRDRPSSRCARYPPGFGEGLGPGRGSGDGLGSGAGRGSGDGLGPGLGFGTSPADSGEEFMTPRVPFPNRRRCPLQSALSRCPPGRRPQRRSRLARRPRPA